MLHSMKEGKKDSISNNYRVTQTLGKGLHFTTSLAIRDMGRCHLWGVMGGQALICLE